MSDAVVKYLKHMNDISSSNIVRKAGVLPRKEVDVPVDWIRDDKQRVPLLKFKVSY